MFKRLVIEKRHSRLGNEEKLLALHAMELDIPVVTTVEKTVARGHFKFRPDDLVAGSVGFMHHAMRNFGIQVHHNHPYPEVLAEFMHRKVLPIHSIYALRKYFIQGGRPVFVKPLQTKKFTGFVADNIGDPRFNGAGNQTEIIVVEPVNFVHEWRIYIVNGWMTQISDAPGGKTGCFPNPAYVGGMVARLNKANIEHVPAAYSLDIGVLDTGQVALVEINDAYSLGAYGDITAAKYWEVIGTRWKQLMENKQ